MKPIFYDNGSPQRFMHPRKNKVWTTKRHFPLKSKTPHSTPPPSPLLSSPTSLSWRWTVDCSMPFVLLTPFQQCQPAKQYDNFSLYNWTELSKPQELVHAFAGLGSVLFLPLWCLNEAKELFTGWDPDFFSPLLASFFIFCYQIYFSFFLCNFVAFSKF